MDLVPGTEQRQVREAAKRFFSEKVGVAQLRSLRDRGDPRGYSRATWQEFIEMGYAAAPIPESHGGLGLGYFTFGGILEESGRVLFASPLLATIVAGASVLELADFKHKSTLMEQLLTGQRTLAFAYDEGPRHTSPMIDTRAVHRDGGYEINGKKSFVFDGGLADDLIVIARTAGEPNSRDGLSMFLVGREAEGVHIQPLQLVDSRNAATITFSQARVEGSALIGPEGQAWSVIDKVLDRLRVCVAAEMLGAIQEVFDRTMSYLKEREQFGVKIGSFQALKHRAGKMCIEIELTRSAVAAGLSALDEQPNDVPLLASLAKARANDTLRLITNEAIQMHGGIGVTDALDIGLFLKRSRVALQMVGDSRFHRDRYASLLGY